ncbi:hypothetical protein MACJ_003605 [Theileria orientalis]|uniref:Uncharacterized protein n=1 Tax=Theileria orientalis TaxID=68886 RepID=A0A976SL18_THEOR|nr:hypothetical protein MACJ_003605 [Theileria orientalis]
MLSIIIKSGSSLYGLYRTVPILPYGSSTTINTRIWIIPHKNITHIGIGSHIINSRANGIRYKTYANITFGPYKSNDLNCIGRRYSSESIELRKRRLLLRAMNTGMKELDLILSEFISLNLEFIDSNLSEFESFLDMETCTIYDILMGKVNYEGGNQVIDHIKSFVANKYK